MIYRVGIPHSVARVWAFIVQELKMRKHLIGGPWQIPEARMNFLSE